MKPTEEQWFWEQCGFEHRYLNVWIFPDGTYGHIPDTDSLEFLGFLFKWAVPNLDCRDIHLQECEEGWQCDVQYGEYWAISKDPAQVLKEAIYKCLGGKE